MVLDATAVPPNRGGVGRYVDGLVGALAELDLALTVVCQANDAAAFSHLLDRIAVHEAPASISSRPARLAWEQTGLPGLARSLGADVLHCPHYTMPLRPRMPTVVTIHDATFFSHPQVHTSGKGRFFRAASRHALRRAAVCLTPSAATKNELIRILRADPAKVRVAHLGFDPAIFAPPAAEAVAKVTAELGVAPGEYVAFLGTLEPRKNVAALVTAFVGLAPSLAKPMALVLAGGRGWDDQLDAVVTAARTSVTVLTPGYLPLEDLAAYLGGACVVAYPSLGEGFGLPVLEAMACGAAVLTTRELSLGEVGGDAVAYSTTRAASIQSELAELIPDVHRREELGRLGIERAREFTWQRCAEAHLVAYREAVA